MASVLAARPYSTQPPPSPPIDDLSNKCTLPSIQSLIGMADSSTPSHEQQVAETEMQHQVGNSQSPRPQAYGQPTVSNPKALPPTPPFTSDWDFDASIQSPSATSSHSSTSAPQFFGSAINNLEPHQQRQAPPVTSHGRPSMAPQASQSPYISSPYASSPGGMSTYSYPSPAIPHGPSPTMYYQRPLPSTFPPPDISNPATSDSHNLSPVDHTNPWQHHHYISPSSSAAFAGQSQDRYICQTCNKAFSRPSSLRIHSHSHTGEKPFRCPHTGCGKAFSVRSNMKRHERGCHGGGSPGSS
ncbi:hypothetical protein MMC12_008505 [Toensbergia leucococca]|nr:hypothetical protein [Toensbergia leucococca]